MRPASFDLEIETRVFALFGLDTLFRSPSDAPTLTHEMSNPDNPPEVWLVLHLAVAGSFLGPSAAAIARGHRRLALSRRGPKIVGPRASGTP